MFVNMQLTVLAAEIVLWPSALAGILSSVAFVGSYWLLVFLIPPWLLVFILTQFELWLTQDRLCADITLFLLEVYVPSYFELAIYVEK